MGFLEYGMASTQCLLLLEGTQPRLFANDVGARWYQTSEDPRRQLWKDVVAGRWDTDPAEFGARVGALFVLEPLCDDPAAGGGREC